jgi:RNA polymerase sigma-70 factor (ECF subfamily)
MSHDLEKRFMDDILSCRGILLKICRTYCPDRESQNDLYQDIVVNAWNAYGRFEGRSKFSTWLYRVALNTALSDVRRKRVRGQRADLGEIENRADHDTDHENVRLLYAAIDELSPAEKSLAVLYLDDLSYKEIADITGITEVNVGVRLFRIKEKLRKWFTVHNPS